MKKSDIENALFKMGVSANLSGFRYITQAVLLLDNKEFENPQWCLIYSRVGEICNSTGSRVERAIRHAFETVRNRGNTEQVMLYIGDSRNANSASLAMLHLRLKQEEE